MSKKPTVLLILDGFGLAPASEANAISCAETPRLDALFASYPNTQLQVLDILNPYENVRTHTGYDNYANFYAWWNDGVGAPRAQCLYSLYGFARGDETGRAFIVDNYGKTQTLPFPLADASQLPVVRYILPYPNAAIQRAAGAYKNYYGYAN